MGFKSEAASDLSLALATYCEETEREQRRVNQARPHLVGRIKIVQASIVRMREDYRHSTSLAVGELENRLSDLELKVASSSGNARNDLESKVRRLKASRAAFLADFRALERIPAQTWAEARAKLDREWKDLTALAEGL